MTGNTGIVALLLDAGADPNVQDGSESLTAISRAAESGHMAVVELFLSHKVSPNVDDRTLLCALRDLDRDDKTGSDGYALVKTLVEHGEDVFMDGWTDERPLVIAAEFGLEDIVALFLSAEFASAEIRQDHICDAVCKAAEEGEELILEMLMEHYKPTTTDYTAPWEWAKSYRFGEAYELLQPYFDPDGEDESEEEEDDDEGEDVGSGVQVLV
ncbi:hypothetical protein ACHAQH_008460 [Verticillium albo-atrum]